MDIEQSRRDMKEMDERFRKRKFFFRIVLGLLILFLGWRLTHTPVDQWRPLAGFLGLAYAALLHLVFYKIVAARITALGDAEKRNKTGFFSAWVYLFFLLGPFFLSMGDFSPQWFRMGFLAGYAIVFALFGSYFEYSRQTWMRA